MKHTPESKEKLRISAYTRDNSKRIASLPRGENTGTTEKMFQSWHFIEEFTASMVLLLNLSAMTVRNKQKIIRTKQETTLTTSKITSHVVAPAM